MSQNVPFLQRIRTPAGVATGSIILFLTGIAIQLFAPVPDAVGSGFATGAALVGTMTYLRLRREQQNQQ